MDDAFEKALSSGSLSGLSAAEVERIKPMLAAALLLQEQAAEIPAPVEKEANKARFLAELAELRAMPAATPGAMARLKAGYKKLMISGLMRSLVATTAVLALTSGVATAAGSSGPESPLYPIKRAVETVETALPRSDLAQAQLHLSLAQTRMAELAAESGGNSATSDKLGKEVLSELDTAKGLTAHLSPAEKQERLKQYDELKQRYENIVKSERQNSENKSTQPTINNAPAPAAPGGGGENSRPESGGSGTEQHKGDGGGGDSGRKSNGEHNAAPENGTKTESNNAVKEGSWLRPYRSDGRRDSSGWQKPPSDSRTSRTRESTRKSSSERSR